MKRWAPWLGVAVALLVIAVLSRGGDDSGEPLDPRSTGPVGARGLVLLLEKYAHDVRIATAPPRPAANGVAVLLADDVGDAQERALRSWVRNDGGTLVVADPFSDFAPALHQGGGDLFSFDDDDGSGDRYSPACTIPPVAGVRAIEVPSAALYRVRPGATGCFRRGDGAYLVARSEGAGTVVALGGGGPLVNGALDRADNAVLAVGLMAPTRATSVVVLEPSAAGSGDRRLIDLVSPRVRAGLWQLAIAFGLFAAWRARRVGRPVTEVQPVQIPGSELVLAVGNLLQQAGRRDAAAGMLRLQLRRDLAERLGLPVDAPPEQLAAGLAPFGIPEHETIAALAPGGVGDDTALVALAARIDSLRREVAHV